MSDPTIITPLSGEIMSGAPEPLRGFGPQGDVVDAEFTMVIRPAATREPPAAKPPPVAGLDILGRAQAAPANTRASAGFWACGLLLAAAAFWMAGGHSLTRNFHLAKTAPVSQIQVASVTSQVMRSGQGAHLMIDGTLENNTETAAHAPDLEIEVAAVGGGVTRYRLGNGGAPIQAHSARNFSSRLAAPATGVRSVSVTVAGGR